MLTIFAKKFRRKKSRAEGGTSDEASVDDFELQQIELEIELETRLRQERTRRRLRKVASCCKTVWTFLFSHIGLSGLVVGYSIMGGFLFRALEAPYELETNIKFREAHNKTISTIVRKAIDLQIRQDMVGNYSDEVEIILRGYQLYVFQAVKSHGWDGEDNSELKWTYAGALLFAVTVITTIGYGHVAPKTSTGRVMTILYALIGIPLTFLCLANIGDFLADCFRMLYAKVCCGLCCLLFRPSKKTRRARQANKDEDPEDNQQRPVENDVKANKKGKKKKTKKDKNKKDEPKGGKNSKNTQNRESTLTETSLLEHCEENHVEGPTDFADLFYQYDEFKNGNLSLEDTKILLKDEDILISVNELLDCKETDLTNDFSEINPDQEAKTPEELQEEETARRARLRRNRSNRRKRNRRKDKRWKSDTEAMFALSAAADESGGSASGSSKRRNLDKISALKHTKSVDIEFDIEHKTPHKEQKVRVPIVLCLLLIAGYVFFGSILFARWEGWDYLTGSYFCFVTLSTIGFGDIVPGMKLDSWASQEKLVACALYLAFGLSVLAMCFNLMQEEVKEKCRWVARKVGILSSEPD